MFILIISFHCNQNAWGQKLKVSSNGRFLVTEDNQPFFWMADTAWELFHRCSKDEAIMYLKKRASQGFNVVQAVALAELDGLNDPNPNGDLPLINNDPAYPNDKYFNHIDFIIKEAEKLGIYIALLPTWGDKLNMKSWGTGPEIFNSSNAYDYGKWIGNRYRDYDNIIWIIGGDRQPREGSLDVEVWNQMANGVVDGAGGYDNTLMSYHPQPKDGGGSSTWFHQEKWLDFNMHQTGHCLKQTYKNIGHDYQLNPIKPVLDAEPLYEDHPNCFNAKELGYSVPEDIRRIMYWNVFSGSFGQSYGCHAVWQMYQPGKEPKNNPLRPWKVALDLPLAHQVKHLKNLMLSRPFLTRIPDQSMITEEQADSEDYVVATRDSEGSYAMVFFPTGKPTQINFSSLNGKSLNASWYDPRTGNVCAAPDIEAAANVMIAPPTSGKWQDWVLVVDEKSRQFQQPGQLKQVD